MAALSNSVQGANLASVALPDAVLHYLSHIELGHSIRKIARYAGCHASTVSRQIRRFENRRDDPLIDGALIKLGQRHFAGPGPSHMPKGACLHVRYDQDQSRGIAR